MEVSDRFMKNRVPGKMWRTEKKGALGALAVAAAVGACLWAGALTRDALSGTEAGELNILCDWSAEGPVRELAARFEKKHRDVKVSVECVASPDGARAIAGGGKKPDIFISSDYTVIETVLMPKSATWDIKFARNYIQLAFTDKSKFADVINSITWHEYLTKPGVKIGCVDPNADPLGYRALLVMQLTAAYYGKKDLATELQKNCAAKDQPKDGAEIVKRLTAGELDYAWLYGSVIRQRGLRYIVLPPECDLSSGSYEDEYKKVKVEVEGATPGSKRTVIGEPIMYGLTIPTNAEHQEAAIAFLSLMLGPVGQQVLKEADIAFLQLMLGPVGHEVFKTSAQASDRTKVPAELQPLCK